MDYGDSNYTDHAIVMAQLRVSYEGIFGITELNVLDETFLCTVCTTIVDINRSVEEIYRKLLTACTDDPSIYTWVDIPVSEQFVTCTEEEITIEPEQKQTFVDKERMWQAIMDLGRGG